MSRLSTYYNLTKPGIIRGNLVAGVTGFLLGSTTGIDWRSGAGLAIGMSLVIAAACVYNNVIDRTIDAQMRRTRKRALPSGALSLRTALWYGSMLGIAGFGVLALFTNLLTVTLGIIASVLYVGAYAMGKRRSIHGTLIGSIPGALPPVAGYAAASGQLDGAAGLLFLALFTWQMPHFYAIALYRLKDYQSAGLPVLPAVKGERTTKWHMLLYAIGFGVVVGLFYGTQRANLLFLLGVGAVTLWWILVAIRGLHTADTERWARRMFGISLIVLLAFCALLSLSAVLG